MPLSVVSNTINGETTGSDVFTYLQQAEWEIQLSDSVSFDGRTIVFNPSLFIDKQLPKIPDNFIPDFGYQITIPTAIGVPVTMGLIGATTYSSAPVSVVIELLAGNILSIKTNFLFIADMNSAVSGVSYQNNTRVLKSSIDNPVVLNNQYTPSVYLAERTARAHFLIINTTNSTIIEQLFIEFDLEARFLNQGLGGNTVFLDFKGWDISLERNGVPVTGLSAYEDTIVRFEVNAGGSLPISPVSEFVVLRTDLAENNIDIVQDLRLGAHVDDVATYGIDYISSYTPWALVAGSVYEAFITIDSSKIETSGSYRIAAVATNDVKDKSGSFLSSVILSDDLPSLTTGTMSGRFDDYNDSFPCDFIQMVQYERMRSCVAVNPTAYQLELDAKGLPGQFLSNLRGVEVVVTNFTDNVEILRINSDSNDNRLTTRNLIFSYESCLEFRYLPEWGANKIIHIDHIYTYFIDLPDNPYTDVVTYRQIVTAPETEENQVSPTITEIRFLDGALNPITQICEDTISPLTVQVVKAATVEDYNLISVIRKDEVNAENQEEDGYTNNILDQLDSELILTSDAQFVGNIATFTVDETLLEKGQKYKVVGIAKEVNLTPPPPCPTINISVETEVLAVFQANNEDNVTLRVTLLVTNYAPEVVAFLGAITDTLPKDLGIIQSNGFGADNGFYDYLFAVPLPNTGSPENINTNIVVTLVNGCSYQVDLVNAVIPILGYTTSQNIDLDAN